jgi:hypothetical protein
LLSNVLTNGSYYGRLDIERFPLSRVARLLNVRGDVLEEPFGASLRVESATFSALAALVGSLSFARRAAVPADLVRSVLLGSGATLSLDQLLAASCVAELDRVWRHSKVRFLDLTHDSDGCESVCCFFVILLC